MLTGALLLGIGLLGGALIGAGSAQLLGRRRQGRAPGDEPERSASGLPGPGLPGSGLPGSGLPGTHGLDALAILEMLPGSVVVADARAEDQPLIYVNEHFERMTGHRRADVLGLNCRFLQGTHRDQPGRHAIAAAIAAGEPVATRLQNYRSDGSSFWNLLHITPLRDEAGIVTHHVGVQMDITDAVRNEQQLERRQMQHYALALTAQSAVDASDVDEILQRCLDVMGRVLRSEHVEVLGLDSQTGRLAVRGTGAKPSTAPTPQADSSADAAVEIFDPDAPAPDVSADHFDPAAEHAGQGGFTLRTLDTVISDDLLEEQRFTRSARLAALGIRSGMTTVILDEDQPWGVLSVYSTTPRRYNFADSGFVQSIAFLLGNAITRLRQSASVAEHARMLDAVLDSTSEGILTIDLAGRIRDANRAAERLLDTDHHEVVGSSIAALSLEDPKAPDAETPVRTLLDTLPPEGRELHLHNSDGERVPVWAMRTETRVDERPLLVLTLRDLRSQKLMEAQLLHAQKLESVGQLTGGVAHDFNNLLTVIEGNTALLGEGLSDPAQLELIRQTQQAAHRGANLTGRLLAFARRQPLQPSRVDANALLQSMEPILRRLIGERHALQMTLAPELPPIHVDGGQLDAAILNLVVNARDALPTGGRIAIATTVLTERDEARMPPGLRGPLLEICVSDDGPGIPAEIRGRIFDPFFTTKAAGVGTGLGLPMVLGFVQQSGGHLLLEDGNPGGAVFRILLPALVGDAARERPAAASAPQATGSALSVLVVEDDEMVRSIAVRMLKFMGHGVTEVDDPEKALAVLRSGAPVDLLFTDMIMATTMTGMDLAKEATRLTPALPIIITSGYVDHGLDGDDQPDGLVFLQKPYSRARLQEHIALALAARRPQGDSAVNATDAPGAPPDHDDE